MKVDKIKRLVDLVSCSDKIVFFGGAGVSTESGLPDFRSSKGLYNESPERILSYSFFIKHPKEFYDFYNKHLVVLDALPNDAHIALFQLEKMNKLSMIITQNIDGLHQMSGSNSVIELHGSIHKNHCMKCLKMFDAKYIKNTFKCDSCGGVIRPNVVMYEEPIDPIVYSKAKEAIEGADLLIVGGTSLVVYPAAGMLRYFKGDNIVFINKTKTNKDSVASLVINDSIGKTLRQMMELLYY